MAGGPDAWNIRDTHMADTLDRLLGAYGPGARAVVWAHNSHVGDARATDLAESGEVSLGQLARERHGDTDVVLVGMGTHRGTVLAGPTWGGPMDAMPLPPARDDSFEDIMHGAGLDRGLFVLPPTGRPDVLTHWLAHRAVGVVYLPARERLANYVPTRLGDRYDAFCWFDETHALHPLPVDHLEPLEPATFPAGV
jgi:erythromycin esterase-like protein